MTDQTLKIGVVFDPWKRPIFKRHLGRSGLTYGPLTELPAGTLGYCVLSNDASAVEKIVRAANKEAADTKKVAPNDN